MDDASTQYDVTKTWAPDPSEYNAPSGTWEDMAIRQATIAITMDRKTIQTAIRPPIPSVLPPGVQFSHTSPSIDDVIYVPRSYEDKRAYFSGSPAGYSGSPRNAWGAAL